jgi:SAM-dependent methyltransferase
MTERVPYDDFADVYGAWSAAAKAVTEPNGRFYADLYVATEGPVVELGVGDGRIAVAAARRGKYVVGVDSSEAMLELCRARATEAGVLDRLTLQRADFRDFTLEEPAALITIPFHAIGHMVTDDEKRAALAHVRGELAPGGRLVLDHFVPDVDLARSIDRLQRLHAVYQNPVTGHDVLLWAVNVYDFETGRVELRAITEELDRDGNSVARRVRTVPFSWIEPERLRALLEETGFAIDDCHGDFEGTPFGPESRSQVWFARRV